MLVTFITLLLAVAKEISFLLSCDPLQVDLPVLTYFLSATAQDTLRFVQYSKSTLDWPKPALMLGKTRYSAQFLSLDQEK